MIQGEVSILNTDQKLPTTGGVPLAVLVELPTQEQSEVTVSIG